MGDSFRAISEKLAARSLGLGSSIFNLPMRDELSHLAILGRAGLVRSQRRSRSIVYRAKPEAVAALASFLVKDAGVDWRRGASVFAERLLDADVQSQVRIPGVPGPVDFLLNGWLVVRTGSIFPAMILHATEAAIAGALLHEVPAGVVVVDGSGS
mgnify:CR=1 FL=1